MMMIIIITAIIIIGLMIMMIKIKLIIVIIINSPFQPGDFSTGPTTNTRVLGQLALRKIAPQIEN